MDDDDAPITGDDVKIACDKVNDNIWLLYNYFSDEHYQIQIAIYDKSSLKAIENSLGREIETTFSLQSSSAFSVVSIAAHNNHLYMCIVYDIGGHPYYNLLDIEYKNGSLTLKKSVNLTKLIKYESSVDDFTPTDMEIQSDLLFVTYSVNSMDLDGNFTYGVYNYGGVFIFNLDDLVQVVPGNSSNTGVGSISGARKVELNQNTIISTDGGGSIIVGNDSTSGYTVRYNDKTNVTLYTPDSSTSNNQFFGAQQIVGIKPKKLIILDQGVFLYVDSEGSTKAEKIARLVELDFEKFAFDNPLNVGIEGFKDSHESYNVSYRSDEKASEYVYIYSSSGSKIELNIDYYYKNAYDLNYIEFVVSN